MFHCLWSLLCVFCSAYLSLSLLFSSSTWMYLNRIFFVFILLVFGFLSCLQKKKNQKVLGYSSLGIYLSCSHCLLLLQHQHTYVRPFDGVPLVSCPLFIFLNVFPYFSALIISTDLSPASLSLSISTLLVAPL